MIIQPGLLYLTRSEWGADTSIPRLGHAVARSNRTEAIIHHTVIVDSDATKNLWTDLNEVKAKVRQLQTIRPDLGMDVPYNFVMFLMEDGSVIVCEGRGLDRTGAHTRGHNTGGVATALQGNFMLAVDLAPYIPFISRWWGWLRYDQEMVNLGSVHPAGQLMYGHRDFRDPNDSTTWTSCPGDNLYSIISQLEFTKEDDMALTPEDKEFILKQTKFLETRQNDHAHVRELQHQALVDLLSRHVAGLLKQQDTHAKAVLDKLDTLQIGGVDIDALAKAVVDEQARRLVE